MPTNVPILDQGCGKRKTLVWQSLEMLHHLFLGEHREFAVLLVVPLPPRLTQEIVISGMRLRRRAVSYMVMCLFHQKRGATLRRADSKSFVQERHSIPSSAISLTFLTTLCDISARSQDTQPAYPIKASSVASFHPTFSHLGEEEEMHRSETSFATAPSSFSLRFAVE